MYHKMNDQNNTAGSGGFLDPKEISDLVDTYLHRKNCEDVDALEKKGGESYLGKGLKSDFKSGLSANDIKDRETRYGSNKRDAKLSKGLWGHIKEACDDLLIKILIGVCIGMLAVHLIFDRDKFEESVMDSVSIVVAVILCVGVSSLNNYQKEKQYLALYKVSEENKYVLTQRNGALKRVHAGEVVVGDIVMLQEGMDIPADGWIVQANDMKIDESQLTGENEAIVKEKLEYAIKYRDQSANDDNKIGANMSSMPSCVVLSGSKVMSGNGRMIVLQVGKNSIMGKMSDLILGDNDSTPLQDKLDSVASNIGKFGTFAAVAIVVVLFIKFLIGRIKEGYFDPKVHWSELISYVLIGLSTAVASIPEGLPLAVTIALAYSARKMLRDKNLVRKLDACETMGGANAICSDKTGTLTQNKMTIKTLFIPAAGEYKPVDIEGHEYKELFPESIEKVLSLNFACNNTANLDPASGAKTDQALLEFLQQYKVDFKALREKYVHEDTKSFSFSSMRKRSAIILDIDNKKTLLSKGAAEYILASCSKIQNQDGSIEDLTEEKRKQIEDVITKICEKALRAVGFGYKEISGDADLKTHDEKGIFTIEQKDLIFSGFVGIGDPLREGVPEAISKCKAAGIKVRMITGDNKVTAKEISRECGILTEGGIVMEGTEFMELTGGVVCTKCGTKECDCPRTKAIAESTGGEIRVDTIKNTAEFDKIYPKLDVLARARPEDKYALVVGLKERGYVVAVTGDGANDAPALIKADVGFAMGESGTEIAKESSDIVIMDDNLKSIVQSVIWGRNVYDNIRKFLQFQLTINVAAVLLIIIGSIILSSPVFTPVQLLWINLVMDTLASLALAAEDPDENVINRPPHKRTEMIISNKMVKHILGQGIYQIIILLVIIFSGDKFIPENLPDKLEDGNSIIYAPGGKDFVRSGRIKHAFSLQNDYDPEWGPSRHFTVVFNAFVFLQVFGFLAARKIDDSLNIFKGIHKSYLFLFIVIFIAVVQALLVQFGGRSMNCHPDGLSGAQWAICLVIGVGGLIINFILKFLPDPKINLNLEKEYKDQQPEEEQKSPKRTNSNSNIKRDLEHGGEHHERKGLLSDHDDE